MIGGPSGPARPPQARAARGLLAGGASPNEDAALPLPSAMGYVAALQMEIGVPKETAAGEHRVALVPEVVGKLKGKGTEVVVENGAGSGALLPDDAYVHEGARITDDAAEVWRSDVVL